MEKHVNLPTLILIASLGKLLVYGASLPEALVFASVSSLYAFSMYLSYKKEPKANKELWDRLIELEEQYKISREKINAVTLAQSLKR